MVSGTTTSLNVEYVFRLIYDVLFRTYIPSGIVPFLFRFWQIVIVVGYIVSIIAIFVLVYSLMRLYDVRRQEKALYGPLPIPDSTQPLHNPRWQQVQELVASDNPNDWRQAIIEADIILGDMLTSQEYKGETIGEQLKQVEPADFLTLNDAWEAHKVRNRIAHDGSTFVLSDIVVRNTIARYENVFREFAML